MLTTPNEKLNPKRRNRAIMVFGLTGTGKSAILNTLKDGNPKS